MENHRIPPICACCREPDTELWAVTTPKVYVICGSAECERWALAQGLRIAMTGSTLAQRPRRPRPSPPPSPAPYLPSPEVVENARSARGGWTQATLAAWGVPWPPPAGWRADLEQRWKETNGIVSS